MTNKGKTGESSKDKETPSPGKDKTLTVTGDIPGLSTASLEALADIVASKLNPIITGPGTKGTPTQQAHICIHTHARTHTCTHSQERTSGPKGGEERLGQVVANKGWAQEGHKGGSGYRV